MNSLHPTPVLKPARLAAAIRESDVLTRLFREAADEQRTAIAAIIDGRRNGELVDQLRSDAGRRLSAGVAQSPLKVLHECAAGCNACCSAGAVDVTPLEALAVADYLAANYNASRLEAIAVRLQANAEVRSGAVATHPASLPCALLDERGQCSVYAARPLACAGAFSMSRQACYLAVEKPLSAAARNVPLDPYAKTWTAGVSGGLQRALVEAGLDGNLYELCSIVLRALQTPDAARRWLKAEDIFHGCTCTDAHSPPRVARLAPSLISR